MEYFVQFVKHFPLLQNDTFRLPGGQKLKEEIIAVLLLFS